MTLAQVIARGTQDKDDIDWLESQHTLHWGVEFWYVVSGYTAQRTYDCNLIGEQYTASTLKECIALMRLEGAGK